MIFHGFVILSHLLLSLIPSFIPSPIDLTIFLMIHAALDASGYIHIHSCYTSPVVSSPFKRFFSKRQESSSPDLQNLVHVPQNEHEYNISKTTMPSFALESYSWLFTHNNTVATKFYEGWQHPKARPTIRNIFYVAYSGPGLTHLGKFSDYRYSNLSSNYYYSVWK